MLHLNYLLIGLLVAAVLYSVYWTVTISAVKKTTLTYVTLFGGVIMAVVGYLLYLIYTAQVVPIQ